LRHGSRLGTEELGVLAQLSERRAAGTHQTVRGQEVTLGSVSELCRIPHKHEYSSRILCAIDLENAYRGAHAPLKGTRVSNELTASDRAGGSAKRARI
jgi:hypothetical protein